MEIAADEAEKDAETKSQQKLGDSRKAAKNWQRRRLWWRRAAGAAVAAAAAHVRTCASAPIAGNAQACDAEGI